MYFWFVSRCFGESPPLKKSLLSQIVYDTYGNLTTFTGNYGNFMKFSLGGLFNGGIRWGVEIAVYTATSLKVGCFTVG